jgi:hypothetical protein
MMRSKRKLHVTPRLFRLLILLFGLLVVLASRSLVSFQSHSLFTRPITLITAEVTSLGALQSYGKLIHEPFCMIWDLEVETWWKDQPDWEIASENSTHQCFQPMVDRRKAAFLNRLHQIQHSLTSCQQEAYYKRISGSGWGIDMAHVVDGLQYAMQHNVPVHALTPTNWQYSVGKPAAGQASSVGTTADLDNYFLPLTTCPRDNHLVRWTLQQEQVAFNYAWQGFLQPSSNEWLLQYATRPQSWLRKQAYDLAASTGLLSTTMPCTAIHVRRNDVVLHGKFSRRYHRVSEYIRAAQRQRLLADNILLLTDDQNAVLEAEHLHAQYKWYYIDRERHKGSNGGWENHIPSHDPSFEVVVLHASLLLLQHCSVLVHSKSNLADYFYANMRRADRSLVHRIDVDQDKHHSSIHNERNAQTATLSRETWRL